MEDKFFDKDEYSWKDIEWLMDEQIEESVHLDYKSGKALSKNDQRKKDSIVKHVSAFANSAGGVLIYGIDEKDHKPDEISFVDGRVISKEWLENVIDSNIQPRIEGLRIFPVRREKDLQNSIYIVKVPMSNDAPHMSIDNKYYRRYNFKAVPMEEYEVRLLYARESTAEMDVGSLFARPLGVTRNQDQVKVVHYEFSINAINIGSVIEKHCKIEFLLENIHELEGVGFTFYKGSNVRQRFSEDKNHVLSGYNESPIFPDEEVSLLTFTHIINFDSYNLFRSKAKFLARLYSSKHTIETRFDDLEEFLKPIEDIAWNRHL